MEAPRLLVGGEVRRPADIDRKRQDMLDLLSPTYLGVAAETISRRPSQFGLAEIRGYLAQDPDYPDLGDKLAGGDQRVRHELAAPRRVYRDLKRRQFIGRALADDLVSSRQRWRMMFVLGTISALRDIPISRQHKQLIDQARQAAQLDVVKLSLFDRLFVYGQYPFAHPRRRQIDLKVRPAEA